MTYEEALKIISRENWIQSSDEDKQEALRAVEARAATEQGRAPVSVEFERMSEDTLGQYDFFQTKKIALNEAILENESAELAVNTVLHEGYHAYQDQVVNGLINQNDLHKDYWEDNLNVDRYISYEQNARGYEEQMLEKDARAYAERETRDLLWEAEMIGKDEQEIFRSLWTNRKKSDDQDENEEKEVYRARRGNSESHSR